MNPSPWPRQSPGARRLKESPAAPAEATPVRQAEEKTESREPETPLCCARCGHVITRERDRTTVNGRATHTRVNPSGFVFHFGCFTRAEGCLVIGPPTAEASWFPGFVWEYAMCAACKTHLGWAFHGESDFLGLMLDRLTAPS
ncbi:cereblon family protein [Archangium lansingense]|uniref:Cereblon family protein n=1 Tax=Archangium lansingense TaxID=2995310 RepID=A0ABT4AKJ6_9BACT|nr:cereblon family protein [Archangium lansinium]MCY1082217.1 cereblon family protein [Archangium lansinium]